MVTRVSRLSEIIGTVTIGRPFISFPENPARPRMYLRSASQTSAS